MLLPQGPAALIDAGVTGSTASKKANRSTSAGSPACGHRSIGRVSTWWVRRRARHRRHRRRRQCSLRLPSWLPRLLPLRRRRWRSTRPTAAGERHLVSSCRQCFTWTAGHRSSLTNQETDYCSISCWRYPAVNYNGLLTAQITATKSNYLVIIITFLIRTKHQTSSHFWVWF